MFYPSTWIGFEYEFTKHTFSWKVWLLQYTFLKYYNYINYFRHIRLALVLKKIKIFFISSFPLAYTFVICLRARLILILSIIVLKTLDLQRQWLITMFHLLMTICFLRISPANFTKCLRDLKNSNILLPQ